ncbi:MAG: insulinase family protein [Ruminococcaceae bacterium]|nr:insulinase family protein [Oscillospiraceae bacterium]MBO5007044.1 insulinase family protein [Clostridia bacterium]
MNIITKENALIGEKYYYTKHKSGLDIYLIPKELSASYALFCTRYGAVDNCFKLEGEEEFTRVPDGIAHYLEHKMFENEDGVDTFSRFAKYGASANAFTSTEVTAYLFKCTENFPENLGVLLDYVTHPYFTPENVEKEQGIIGQEIRGREDHPDFAVYMNLIRALYKDSQINIDVAGTVESIAEINADTLYKCYEVFYHLSNMFLCVAGNVTMEEILAVADKMLPAGEVKNIVRSYNEESREVAEKFVSARFEVAKPMFLMGVKDIYKPLNAHDKMKRTIALQLATETLFGDASEFAVDVYESALIDEMEAGYSAGKISAHFIFGGETDDIDAATQKFISYMEDVKKNGIDPEAFENARRAKYAEYIRSFESVNIAEVFAMSLIKETDWFEIGDIIAKVTVEEANALVRELFDEKYYATSVVYPLEKEDK